MPVLNIFRFATYPCAQALTVQNSTTRTDPALAAACRGLGLTVFSAVSLGQHALRIRSLQVRRADCTIGQV